MNKKRIPWNKGKKGLQKSWAKGHTKFTHPSLMKVSIKNSQRTEKQTSMYGRKHTEETKKKMSIARLKNPTNVFEGKKRPELIERFTGSNNPNWNGGTSFLPYPPSFNQQLKDKIRVRDNFICQLCGVPELECKRRLAIHHINYNKKNNDTNNLRTTIF